MTFAYGKTSMGEEKYDKQEENAKENCSKKTGKGKVGRKGVK